MTALTILQAGMRAVPKFGQLLLLLALHSCMQQAASAGSVLHVCMHDTMHKIFQLLANDAEG